MSLDASPALPVKVLVALTIAVLLLHYVALRASSAALGLSAPHSEPPRAFITRTIELAPPRSIPAGTALAPVAPPSAKPARAKPQFASITPPDAPAEQAPAPAQLAVNEPVADEVRPPLEAQPANEPPAEADSAAPAQRPAPEPSPALSVHALPPPVRLSYTVQANKFPFSLNSELMWSHDGTHFEARLEFSAFGQSRLQTSRGDIAPEGLAPLRFSDKFRSEVAAHFDRQKGKVTFSANTPDAPLLPGAQDRLSILVQLAAMVASHPEAYPEATTIAIQTIGPREADTWLFTVGQTETLTLPGGEQTALKLVRNPRKEFDLRVELWLAPAMSYLPVRIRITEANGVYVDQKWRATHKDP